MRRRLVSQHAVHDIPENHEECRCVEVILRESKVSVASLQALRKRHKVLASGRAAHEECTRRHVVTPRPNPV